jgi:hypothetical protein
MLPEDPADRARVIRNRYRKRRELAALRGIPAGPVDAQPIRDKVGELVGIHWTYTSILAAAKVPATVAGLTNLVEGGTLKAERKFEAILNLPHTLTPPDWIPGSVMVPALGATRRVQALMAIGWPHTELQPRLAPTCSSHIAIGRYDVIKAETWRRIDAVYRELCATPGPSRRGADYARKNGYASAFAWECIDDPDEHPNPRGRPICQMAGCRHPSHSLNLCRSHYDTRNASLKIGA